MTFQYTAIEFDHNDAFPGSETVRTMSNAMVERGNLASMILRVMDTLDHGQGHTICFNYLNGGALNSGALNAVETAFYGGAGYVVATREIMRLESGHFTDFKSLMQAIEDNSERIALADGVGLSTDPDTGETVLDIVLVILHREIAVNAGRGYRQYSIYDIVNGEEIVL